MVSSLHTSVPYFSFLSYTAYSPPSSHPTILHNVRCIFPRARYISSRYSFVRVFIQDQRSTQPREPQRVCSSSVDRTDRSIYHPLVNGKLIPNERKQKRESSSIVLLYDFFSVPRGSLGTLREKHCHITHVTHYRIFRFLFPFFHAFRFLPSFFVLCSSPSLVPSLLPQAPSFNLPHTVLLFFFSFYICTNTCIYSSTIEYIHTRAHARARVRRVLECAFV